MAAIFVYGTLMPGRLRWPIVAPYVVGQEAATIVGTLLDTGRGYPGLRLAGAGTVHGWRLTLGAAATEAWAVLDEVEGPEYRRVAVTTSAGAAETYEWLGRSPGEIALPHGRWEHDAEA